MASKLNICLSSDNNYVQHMAVTIRSLIENHKNEELKIYILDSGISEENRKIIAQMSTDNAKIIFKIVDEELFRNVHFPSDCFLTSATFNRFKIPEYFADLDRVLYMDVDIVVLGDLSEFYNMDMEDKSLAMIADWNEDIFKPQIGVNHYYNAGVMLFDIKKCVANNVYSILMEFLKNNKKPLKMFDQDIINLTCQNLIKPVDFVWNAQIHPNLTSNIDWIEKNMSKVKILHYTSQQKPWKSEPVPFEDYYFNYLALTEWKDAAQSIKVKKKLNKIKNFIYSTQKVDHNKKYLKFLGIKWFSRIKSDGINHFYFLGMNFFNQKRKKN